MKTGVIYARYSSRGQTEQSIEGQLRVCYKFAEENDIAIVKVYVDRAKTAQNDMRPDFQRMLADSAKKTFDYVIVYAVDRFSRDDGDYGYDKKLLRQNGVKLLSATETIGTNADGSENLGGILTEGLLVALAKYYSRELSKKVKRGQYETLQKGTFLGGSLLYGFYVENKVIRINEDQANVVRKMFKMYSEGRTAFDIASYLNNKGVTNQKGKPFVPNTIMNMLKNSKYIGMFKYGDYLIEDYYPPIVDKQIFENVQEKIILNKRSPARLKAKELYMLSSKLYCGYCKTLMTGESGTGRNGTIHHYYKCFGRKKKNGCTKKSLPKRYLEDLVIEATLQHVLSPNIINSITEQILYLQEKQQYTEEVTLLRKELKQIETHIDNLLVAIKNGIITDSTKNELLSLEKSKKELEEKLVVAEHDTRLHFTREHIEFWFDQFSVFNKNDESARQYLINYFINKVILYDDKAIIIYNHDGDNRTELDIEDIEEALGSNLTQLAPPSGTVLNHDVVQYCLFF